MLAECDLCGKFFQGVANINKHRQKKHMKRTKNSRLGGRRFEYNCDHCEYEAKRLDHLASHNRIKHEEAK